MYAIEMQGITKTFHGSYANKEVSLKVEQGEIHSLLGENGAGKTTLMKILFGLYKADKGRILINGSPAVIRSPHDAIDYGISMVHQHFVLVGNLTITENIILGHEPRKGILLDRGKARQKVEALIRRYHFGLNPESRIENLSVGEKQRVEILKAPLQRIFHHTFRRTHGGPYPSGGAGALCHAQAAKEGRQDHHHYYPQA